MVARLTAPLKRLLAGLRYERANARWEMCRGRVPQPWLAEGDGRAAIEPRIHEGAGWNLAAFQRTCLPESWQNYTLQKLRFNLFLLPGELTRPQNRPTLRLKESPIIERLAIDTLAKVAKITPLPS